MPGVEIHANAIQQILDHNYISVPTHSLSYSHEGRFSQISIIILFSIVTFLVLTFLNTAISSIIVGVEIVGWFMYAIGAFMQDFLWFFKMIAFKIFPDSWIEMMLSKLAFNVPEMGESIMLPVVFPIMSIFVTYGLNLAYSLVSSQKDRKFLKGTFETYISPELIEQMYEDKREPKLGGDEGVRTAFFSDIQSFSTFSESLNPSELVELLNEYFTPMTNLLLKHKGTLDKYEGDGIVAFFGAPIPMEDHAKQAIDTAIEMQDTLDCLRAKWASNSGKWPELVSQMRMRIGVNSGNIVTGNMGSAVRMNYTMMGDVVNTASRIEMAAKFYGVYIHCSEDSLEMAGKDKYEWRRTDKVQLLGKAIPTETIEILGYKGQVTKHKIEMVDIFHEGIKLYRKQEWDKAISKFQKSSLLEEQFPHRPTNPSLMYIERCNQLKNNPPDRDWDGTFILFTK